MRLREIQVTGLFGTFDHTIPLVNPDGVTIIHGPNGYGKTVMLKMIAALVEGDINIFERVPFSEFKFILSDGSTGTVRQREKSAPNGPHHTSTIEFGFTDANGEISIPIASIVAPDIPQNILRRIDTMIPAPFHLRGDYWHNINTNERYSLTDILNRFPPTAKHLPKKYRLNPFADKIAGLEVFFVETNRLNAESFTTQRNFIAPSFDPDDDADESNNPTLRVEQYSRDIVQRIKNVLADYAKHSQESDRTFPERLVRFIREGVAMLPDKEILEQMNALEKKRLRLITLGFLDSESGLRDLTEEDVQRAREALTIYVGDVQKKLAVFDDLAERVGKLIDIVNDRFKYKKLELHREEGFRIHPTSGDRINLDDLSSGEQNELVLLYELLFRAPKNGLVLVDEPEISLHVAWQSKFLEDLMAIFQLSGSYGIVTTHSPVIIGSRWDLTMELKGPGELSTEVNS